MDLDLKNLKDYNQIIGSYKSVSQRVRRLSEKWAADNLYCPKCGSSLEPYQNNKPVSDFYCNHSEEKFAVLPYIENYQLKSMRRFPNNSFPCTILGGEYKTTKTNMELGKHPSLILLHYENKNMRVEDVLAIHRLSITLTSIKRRKPLSVRAKRPGWQGCTILLDNISNLGRVTIVENSEIIDEAIVIKKWNKIPTILQGDIKERGWTNDVLRCIEQLPEDFSLNEVYSFKSDLEIKHSKNRHIKDKIRQQLQILRDRKVIKFVEPGRYKMII